LDSQHYILPQWLQILKAYSEINPSFDQNLLSQECRRLNAKGYGLPPEVHGAQTKDKVIKSPPLVSILVCTHNRSACLQQALASLVRQKTSLGKFEIIVVDNASSDDTREVVMRFCEHHAQVRYLYEPRLGVAIARNTGARASSARYIAYFDDDLIAEEDCLHHLLSPFQELAQAPLAVMGKVELLWHRGRPAWFPENHESLLSRFDLGSDSRWMGPEDYLITMNVAFERETFVKTGGIREDLSRRGRMLICSGDNDIFNRYMKLKLPIFYQPKALVHHLVLAPRQTRAWLFKRAFGEGASMAIARWAGAPRFQVFRHSFYDAKLIAQSVFEVSKNCLIGGNIQEAAYILSRRLGRLSVNVQFLLGMRKPITLSE
jgi:glycosyltransferase involved in cell wall biosynthesis